jgi:Uncharacterized protein, probably involved in trehalose biosynthesis
MSKAGWALRWPTGATGPRRHFLGAYRETMVNQRLWPAGPDAADGILNFFLLEKACYEVEYELSYRPDWLRTALTGILRILSQQSLEAS